MFFLVFYLSEQDTTYYKLLLFVSLKKSNKLQLPIKQKVR